MRSGGTSSEDELVAWGGAGDKHGFSGPAWLRGSLSRNNPHEHSTCRYSTRHEQLGVRCTVQTSPPPASWFQMVGGTRSPYCLWPRDRYLVRPVFRVSCGNALQVRQLSYSGSDLSPGGRQLGGFPASTVLAVDCGVREHRHRYCLSHVATVARVEESKGVTESMLNHHAVGGSAGFRVWFAFERHWLGVPQLGGRS